METQFALKAETALLAGMPELPTSAAGRDLESVRRTAREFEEVFLAQMLQPMLAGLAPEAPFGGGPGEDIWQSMLVSEYGKAIVARGGIGLADAVMREILQSQEAIAADHFHHVERTLPR